MNVAGVLPIFLLLLVFLIQIYSRCYGEYGPIVVDNRITDLENKVVSFGKEDNRFGREDESVGKKGENRIRYMGI
jgi:hypothetical protein